MATARRTRKGNMTTIDLKGGFFERDPVKTWNDNMHDFLMEIAKQGESDAKIQYPVGPGPNHAREGIVGRVVAVSGKPWRRTAVISMAPVDADARRIFPWENHGTRGYSGRSEAIYRGGKVEAKLHIFRKTKNRLGKWSRASMKLLKGLN